jgi:hypothetical protein
VSILKRIFDHYSVFIKGKDLLFGQDHPSYTINCAGYCIATEFAYIFMTFGTVIIAMVFADSGVETLPVTDDSCIKRRQENIPVSSQCVDGTDQQAVVLAGVAANNCGA